jgi:hypothetical protein
MPEAQFGKKLNLPSAGSKFIKLTAKGDKIKFRIASTAHYQTKHWLDKETVLCTRYNAEDKKAECINCDKHQKLVDAGNVDEAKKIAPVTTFYYPILNLADDTAAVFQFTAKSIHYTIAGYADEGVDVFACDWSVERTEEKGNYYKVLRLDSKPLNKEQKAAIEAAKNIKFMGKESSSVVIEDEVETQK